MMKHDPPPAPPAPPREVATESKARPQSKSAGKAEWRPVQKSVAESESHGYAAASGDVARKASDSATAPSRDKARPAPIEPKAELREPTKRQASRHGSWVPKQREKDELGEYIEFGVDKYTGEMKGSHMGRMDKAATQEQALTKDAVGRQIKTQTIQGVERVIAAAPPAPPLPDEGLWREGSVARDVGLSEREERSEALRVVRPAVGEPMGPPPDQPRKETELPRKFTAFSRGGGGTTLNQDDDEAMETQGAGSRRDPLPRRGESTTRVSSGGASSRSETVAVSQSGRRPDSQRPGDRRSDADRGREGSRRADDRRDDYSRGAEGRRDERRGDERRGGDRRDDDRRGRGDERRGDERRGDRSGRDDRRSGRDRRQEQQDRRERR